MGEVKIKLILNNIVLNDSLLLTTLYCTEGRGVRCRTFTVCGSQHKQLLAKDYPHLQHFFFLQFILGEVKIKIISVLNDSLLLTTLYCTEGRGVRCRTLTICGSQHK